MLKLYKSTFYCLSGLLAALLITSPAYASDSVIRVKCDENGSETKIYLNNQYKGSCPVVTAFVKAGRLEVRAQKRVDAEHEQVFIQQLNIVKGVAERINIELGAVQLTAAAKKARHLAAAKAKKMALQKDLTAARAGELAAMKKMVERYTVGDGVTASSSKVNFWRKKIESSYAQADLIAARKGDSNAMHALVERYKTGKGVAKSSKKAQFWNDKIAAILAEAEAIAAQADLRSANAGDIKAMKRLANRYATGNGLDKNQQQAQTWLDKADNLERAKRAQVAHDARRRSAQKELDAITYTFFLKDLANDRKINPFESTVMAPTATLFDVTSTPFNITKQVTLSQQVAAHPSAWAKPDSMMAKAYRQQQSAEETPLLAAR